MFLAVDEWRSRECGNIQREVWRASYRVAFKVTLSRSLSHFSVHSRDGAFPKKINTF